MNSTIPNPAPSAIWRALRFFLYAVLPVACLNASPSGGAPLPASHASSPGTEPALRSLSLEWEWAVIDRFEPGEKPDAALAVLLIGDGEAEHVIDASLLPEGALPGVWLRFRPDEDGALAMEIDHQRTLEAKDRVIERLDALRKRNLQRDTP